MAVRAWTIVPWLTAMFACGPVELALMPGELTQTSGGELHVTGEFAGHGGVVVLIDDVAAHAVVIESPTSLRARIPPLPRTGTVDVELLFADGERMVLDDALTISAPRLDVR